jgi:hypothetical protein
MPGDDPPHRVGHGPDDIAGGGGGYGSADLKVRIVLKAEWVDDGTVDGAISETRMVLGA